MRASEQVNTLGRKPVDCIPLGDIRHLWYDKGTDTINVVYYTNDHRYQKQYGPKATHVHELVEGYQEYCKAFRLMQDERFNEIFIRLDSAAEE